MVVLCFIQRGGFALLVRSTPQSPYPPVHARRGGLGRASPPCRRRCSQTPTSSTSWPASLSTECARLCGKRGGGVSEEEGLGLSSARRHRSCAPQFFFFLLALQRHGHRQPHVGPRRNAPPGPVAHLLLTERARGVSGCPRVGGRGQRRRPWRPDERVQARKRGAGGGGWLGAP